MSYPGHSLGWEVSSLCSDTVGIFYRPSQLTQNISMGVGSMVVASALTNSALLYSDYNTVTWWCKKFYLSGKNTDDQAISGRISLDFEALFQAIEVNQISSTSLVFHSPICFFIFIVLVKSIQSCQMVPHSTKIQQNVWLSLIHTQWIGWFVVWVYGISIFVRYLKPNPFLCK